MGNTGRRTDRTSKRRARRRLAALLSLAGLLSLTACDGRDGSGRLVIRNVTLIDGTGAAPRSELTIVVEDRRIAAIGPADSLPTARGDSVIDASGMWAIPGLFDAHVHLTKAGPEALPVFVGLGITTVRDMGGDLEQLRAMQASIAAGETVGPRMLVAGPMLEAPATLERMAKSATSEPYERTRIPIADTIRARQVVDSLAGLGVDFIKIREYASEATYRAVVAAAHADGLPIAGHAPFSMDPVEGARLGMVSFEHASYPYPLDTVPARRRQILDAFRESGVAIVPTLVAWTTNVMDPDSLALLVSDEGPARDPRRKLVSDGLLYEWKVDLDEQGARSSGYYAGYWGFIDRMSEDLLAMYRAGIPLVAGSDLASIGLVPGYSLHQELEDLVELVGLTPLEAISSATLAPARMMSLADSLGSLEPGKLADLVLLGGDPTADIRNTRSVAGVVLDGAYLSSTRLAELRDGVPATATGGIGLVRRE